MMNNNDDLTQEQKTELMEKTWLSFIPYIGGAIKVAYEAGSMRRQNKIKNEVANLALKLKSIEEKISNSSDEDKDKMSYFFDLFEFSLSKQYDQNKIEAMSNAFFNAVNEIDSIETESRMLFMSIFSDMTTIEWKIISELSKVEELEIKLILPEISNYNLKYSSIERLCSQGITTKPTIDMGYIDGSDDDTSSATLTAFGRDFFNFFSDLQEEK